MVSAPVCPHCGIEFGMAPKRASDCRACGGAFVVRKHGEVLFGRSVLTKREALVLASFQYPQQLGVTPEDFRQALATREPGPSRPADALWTLWQAALGTRPELAPWHYLQMAIFVNAEGRNPAYLLEARQRAELSRWRRYSKRTGLKVRVEILSLGNACEACRRMNGRVYDLDDAFAEMPLPCKDCTCPSAVGRPSGPCPICQCTYLIDIDV
jgi:hypothetical protein